MNADEAKIGANKLPKGENIKEERNVMAGNVVPSVSSVLLLASKRIFVFSAMNKASDCSNPVLCISHDSSR